MVAYSFNKQFIEPIRLGTKTHTIRALGKRRHAKAGEMLQLYPGMRTAHCMRIIQDVPCIDSCTIWINFDDAMRIRRIETFGIPVIDLDAFARRDGFDDLNDMAAFWKFTHGRMEKFIGRLIEWTPPVIVREAAA